VLLPLTEPPPQLGAGVDRQRHGARPLPLAGANVHRAGASVVGTSATSSAAASASRSPVPHSRASSARSRTDPTCRAVRSNRRTSSSPSARGAQRGQREVHRRRRRPGDEQLAAPVPSGIGERLPVAQRVARRRRRGERGVPPVPRRPGVDPRRGTRRVVHPRCGLVAPGRARVLLPGITVLIRLVSKVREAAAQTDPALPGRLLASLRVPAGVRFSEMESWRRPPTRVSGPGLVRALDRAADLAGLGVRAVDCSGVPPNRVAALARFGPPRPDPRFAPGAAHSRRRGQRPRTVPLPVDARTQLRRWLSETTRRSRTSRSAACCASASA